MPAVRNSGLFDAFERTKTEALARREEVKRHQSLLPADFAGQVLAAARKEAERVRQRLAEIEPAIEAARAEIKAAQAAVLAASPQILHPKRRNALWDPDGAPVLVPSGARVRTEAALKVERAQAAPARARLRALERERDAIQSELRDLRLIAERAAEGSVGLIHFLSDVWMVRLEIGPAHLGKLPKPVRQWRNRDVLYVDAAGNPLPPEALDKDGKPDVPVPLEGEPVRETDAREQRRNSAGEASRRRAAAAGEVRP